MAKITSDKYYTPIDVANHCWDKVNEIIGLDNISEIIEPSCGNGSFFHYDLRKPDFGIDIIPDWEEDNIFKSDFIEMVFSYKKNRLIIGNPPYGDKMSLAQKFYRKAVEIGDYIAFILPISQLNNTQSLYQFDLIYSEDIGTHTYTDRKLHCCLNIYKRPDNGILNGKPKNKIKGITIKRKYNKGYDEMDCDIRICGWGDGTAGKILSEGESYAEEYKIKIDENCEKREEIIQYLKSFDWKKFLSCIAMRKIQIHHIVKILKEQFPDLE